MKKNKKNHLALNSLQPKIHEHIHSDWVLLHTFIKLTALYANTEEITIGKFSKFSDRYKWKQLNINNSEEEDITILQNNDQLQ